jgi:hypothetical protein
LSESADSEARAKAIVEAAERAAAEILADATRDAERRVQDARGRAEAIGRERVEMMSALSDALLEQATTVKRQADVLIEALDRVIATLEQERNRPSRPPPQPPRTAPPRRTPAPRPAAPAPRPAGPPRPSAPAAQRPPAPPPKGSDPRGTEQPRAQDPQRPKRKPVSEGMAEGARILATQMAVAGSTRAEILVRLRKEFGIEDPEPIVDGVVGGPSEPPAS